MSENITLVTELVRSGRLRSASDAADLPTPDAGAVDGARIEGMLLGLCIGDSLGNTTESMVPRDRRMRFGVISDYLPSEYARGRAVGVPSDDTQLAVWTLEHLLANGGLDPAALGEAFASRGRIFGIGSTVRAFLSARKAALHWLDAAQESAGNGALMRIAPLVLPHLASPSRGLWADTLLAGAVTHNDFASNAACVGFVNALWRALRARAPVPRGFWLKSFGAPAQRVEGDERRYVPRTPGTGTARENMSRFTDRVVREALSREVSTVEACDGWYSGAFLLETVPSVLYILERHGNDPEEAIVRAVNDTRDNDTVAAIVGAAVGALHGVDALPRHWREGLLGRTDADDDGHVQQTVARARAALLPRPEASGGVSRRTRDGIRGCLLGGAVGDALGAPVEFIDSIEEIRERFGPGGVTDYVPAFGRLGAITDDTQMTLFTAEGLIRAAHRIEGKGSCSVPDVTWFAYRRWLRTQTASGPAMEPAEDDGWLVRQSELYARRAPGMTCLAALEGGQRRRRDEPTNGSKGCGGVMRIAPVGLAGRSAFELGCDLAALTHGHQTGWLAAGYLAELIDRLCLGHELREAAELALLPLRRFPESAETLASVESALALASAGAPSADRVASLGKGWVAEEALAIGLYCALVARDFEHGVLLAVNHAGDSDSTGSITGNILGLLHGEKGIPVRWLAQLECRELIAEVADDLWGHFGSLPAPHAAAAGDERGGCPLGDWGKYPGC